MNEYTAPQKHKDPYLHASSDRRAYGIEKILDLDQPSQAGAVVQSATPFGDGYLVLHHGSVLRRYSPSSMVEEVALVGGTLEHPNDCQIIGDDLWVVDTGTSAPDVTPLIKIVDLNHQRVVREINPALPGWRIAAISASAPGLVWLVAVQDISKQDRDTILLLEMHTEDERIARRITVPVDQYYVQGCALNGRELNIVVNNGRSPISKILRVDLEAQQITEVIVAPQIGELEGLNLDSAGQRPSLISAVRTALLRIPL